MWRVRITLRHRLVVLRLHRWLFCCLSASLLLLRAAEAAYITMLPRACRTRLRQKASAAGSESASSASARIADSGWRSLDVRRAVCSQTVLSIVVLGGRCPARTRLEASRASFILPWRHVLHRPEVSPVSRCCAAMKRCCGGHRRSLLYARSSRRYFACRVARNCRWWFSARARPSAVGQLMLASCSSYGWPMVGRSYISN